MCSRIQFFIHVGTSTLSDSREEGVETLSAGKVLLDEDGEEEVEEEELLDAKDEEGDVLDEEVDVLDEERFDDVKKLLDEGEEELDGEGAGMLFPVESNTKYGIILYTVPL